MDRQLFICQLELLCRSLQGIGSVLSLILICRFNIENILYKKLEVVSSLNRWRQLWECTTNDSANSCWQGLSGVLSTTCWLLTNKVLEPTNWQESIPCVQSIYATRDGILQRNSSGLEHGLGSCLTRWREGQIAVIIFSKL